MTYYQTNIEYLNDYVYCREEDDYLCEENCKFCPNEMSLRDVFEQWQLILKESQNELTRIVIEKVDYNEFKNFINQKGFEPDNPYSVFSGHDETYLEIVNTLPSYIDTVIDFGGSNGLQWHIFDNVRYINVDDFNAGLSPEYYLMTAQDFINEYLDDFNQETTLAVCLNVPDEEARQIVLDNFENNWVKWCGDRL